MSLERATDIVLGKFRGAEVLGLEQTSWRKWCLGWSWEDEEEFGGQRWEERDGREGHHEQRPRGEKA